jgi:hypothetical protein
MAVLARVKQPHEYIIRRNPLSTKSGLISSLISVPNLASTGPLGCYRDRWIISYGARHIVADDSDRKRLFADFGLC